MAILLPKHSFEEILDISFAELRKGTVQKKHPFRNVVFSTIKEGAPKTRWLVCRKLTENQHFLIFTDARSDKVTELKENANCGLLFYHPKQGLQIRIEGSAQLHLQNDLTRNYWNGIKGNGLRSYTTVSPPGSPINDKEQGNQWLDESCDQYFQIIEFIPEKMDVLQLDREAHIRAKFSKVMESWEGVFVVP